MKGKGKKKTHTHPAEFQRRLLAYFSEERISALPVSSSYYTGTLNKKEVCKAAYSGITMFILNTTREKTTLFARLLLN